MVAKKYEEYIKECNEIIEKNNKEIEKLNPDKIYQIKNKVFTWKVKGALAMSIIPFLVSVFVGLLAYSFVGIWGFRAMIGLSLIIGAILQEFLWKNKGDSTKELTKGKTQPEIIKLLTEQRAKVAGCKFRNKIEEKVINNISVRVRHINSLSGEFTIEVKEHKDKKEILDKYEELNSIIQREEEKIKGYAIKQQILDNMSFIFKGGLMEPISMSALLSICAMMYWNIPVMLENKEANTAEASMLEVILPFVITFIVSVVYTYINRKIYRKAFELLNAEFTEKIDSKREAYYIQQELQKEIDETEQTIIDKKLEMAELSLAL